MTIHDIFLIGKTNQNYPNPQIKMSKHSWKICLALFLAILGLTSHAATDPTATRYSFEECQGSSMPYPQPAVSSLAYPDSLTPVFINHVGRHGARFLSSSRYTTSLLRTLHRADSLKTITNDGRALMKLCDRVVTATAGRWGALDSLGMAEQRAIASRTFTTFRPLFQDTRISAISSYVPRSIMSMYEFTHQLSRLNNKIEIYASSGRQYSSLLRPWMDDAEYKDFIESESWHEVYDQYFTKNVPESPALRVLGNNYPFDRDEARDFTMDMYKMLAGCAAMSLNVDLKNYFTLEEINSCWSVENLHHYLTYSSSTLSSVPAEMSAKLLDNLIVTMQEAVDGENEFSVMLRFGHAETLMPLLALMHLPSCYYMTNYFDTVGLHWCDFHIVPMSSNLQMILFKSTRGRYYVRTDLNETPVSLIPGRDMIYIPWNEAKEYLFRCLPLSMQL